MSFMPSLLGIPYTSNVPLYRLFFTVSKPVNTLPLNYQTADVCSIK